MALYSNKFSDGIIVAALAWTLTLTTGCDLRKPPEGSADALADGMEKAAVLQKENRFVEAAEQYRKVLRQTPDNALAHCELGILLQDNQNDPSAAIYHYSNFLDLRPGSEMIPLIRERVKSAEETLAQRASKASPKRTAVTDEQIVGRIEELNGQVAERDRSIARLNESIAVLKRDNERLAKEVRSLNTRMNLMLEGMEKNTRPSRTVLRNLTIDDLADTGSRPAATVSKPTPQPSVRRSDRTYRVRRGDSLWSIAQKVYGDPSRSVDIRNANRKRVGPNDRLTEGDELIIPFP